MPSTKFPVQIQQDKIEQPLKSGGRRAGIPSYFSGGNRSVARLKNLNYDPIARLVQKYNELDEEIAYQKKLRSGALVELNAAGKPRAYRVEAHYALFDKQISIGEKLLRYGYGRVPEVVEDEKKIPMPLVINLTKKGSTYVINEEQPDGVIEDEKDFD